MTKKVISLLWLICICFLIQYFDSSFHILPEKWMKLINGFGFVLFLITVGHTVRDWLYTKEKNR